MKSTIFLALLGFGCGETTPQINITKTIGVEGGSVTGSDGTQLNVPMGALSAEANITISQVTVTPPPGTALVGPAYDFQPEGTTFTQAVTITLPYDNAKIPAGLTPQDVVIYTAPRGSTNYQALFTTLDPTKPVVFAQTTHLSVYLPATPLAACSPTCSTGGESCECHATCMGKQQVIQCYIGSGGSLSCFCELDHQTMSAPPVSSCSTIMAGFNTCFNNGT